mmetsp:Transcript_81364/g.248583  ORF Transcript_81364/g.248583 Transcript_81364/m.248583 type:complete len:95 (-) Transcript_81364:735-1019(-)
MPLPIQVPLPPNHHQTTTLPTDQTTTWRPPAGVGAPWSAVRSFNRSFSRARNSLESFCTLARVSKVEADNCNIGVGGNAMCTGSVTTEFDADCS